MGHGFMNVFLNILFFKESSLTAIHVSFDELYSIELL